MSIATDLKVEALLRRVEALERELAALRQELSQPAEKRNGARR